MFVIVIGATNYQERIARSILDRFAIKVEVKALSGEQRGKLIASEIKKELLRIPKILLDAALEEDCKQGCLLLGKAAANLSVRAICQQIGILFGKLRCECQHNSQAQAVLQLADLANAFEQANQFEALARRDFISSTALPQAFFNPIPNLNQQREYVRIVEEKYNR